MSLPVMNVLVCGKPLSLWNLNSELARSIGFQWWQQEPDDSVGLLFPSLSSGDSSERSPKLRFHMRNVPFDVDALGFDSDNDLVQVVHLKAMNPEPVEFDVDVVTVVEVAGGWADRHSVQPFNGRLIYLAQRPKR